LHGRSIKAGDIVPLRMKWAPDGRELRAAPLRRAPGPLRVVLGPQVEDFTPESVATFLADTWRVTHRGDRMGMWLEGPRLSHTAGYDLVSDGLVPGCIQVPGSGQPVVLLMDCQTVGGYPKIATIITADLPRLAQSRPGTEVTFAAVDIATAQHLYRSYHAVFADIGRTVQAVPDVRPGSSWLMV
jgi:allophanate hydrolase subunit 2